MRRWFSIIWILLLMVSVVFSQEKSSKEKALEEFKNEHYTQAIDWLEKALKESPQDAEIYYYLGWFNHYRAYDSRPLGGYDYSYSEQIFNYLDKALELNPDYGDAKYFYGAECSGNAFIAMQNNDADKLKYYYQLAYQKGAYPDWLIEFGKNILMNCEENAILFTGGNADFDICSYLQLCQNFRNDVTVIPIGNIDRPWYVSFLKNGLKNCVRSVSISLTEHQIMDIHPFKWKSTEVAISVSSGDKLKFGLPEDYHMAWTVDPDLTSERMHSKIEGEEAKKRTYLSPQRAVLLQIVEDNFDKRPIFFSNFASPIFYGGLEDHFQNRGLVSQLLPIKTQDSDYVYDASAIEKLIDSGNLSRYKTIKNNDFPRISGIVISGYSSAFLNLAEVYRKSDRKNELNKLIELYKKCIIIDFKPDYEQMVLDQLEQ
ncbi:MAG: hypothetical protein KBA26_13830 [Candidatus Delongbacteria bacterium]|nr:hypothetical protein [Candidatus Delongbacteria bacterium]